MNNLLQRIIQRLDIMRSSVEPTLAPPDELLGELFYDVQLRRIYPDGMIFVDMMPAAKLNMVLKQYEQNRHDPDFDLAEFVKKHFKNYMAEEPKYISNPGHSMEQHIEELWTVLRRQTYKNTGSLVGLPHPYVVAGGRFMAQFYWDSYFIMLGLATSGYWDMVENMVNNCAYMISRYGCVPTANRTYFTSRSQPPFFALMVQLLAAKKGKSTLARYLPSLLAEHKFWMKGESVVAAGKKLTVDRVVRMPGGEILNHYYDSKSTPRPESYKEDVATALAASDRSPSAVYVDLRAGAESGWDFSSRWFADGKSLQTIVATDIVPVDLNCLLVVLEQTIAGAYGILMRPKIAQRYRRMAEDRKRAINKYCWDEKQAFYLDYNYVTGKRTSVVSCAGLFPLYVGASDKRKAKLVAGTTRRKLLKSGGLLCTTINTGEQWDAPNGWAPLHWAAIRGFRQYGFDELASDIKRRWLNTVKKMYSEQGKMVEKYNVLDTSQSAGGGEYALQDGFGWTNGVTLALIHEDKLHW